MEVGALEVVLGIEAAEFISGLGNAGKAVLAFTEGLREIGKEAIDAASKAQNVTSELKGLFGDQAEQIHKFAEQAGAALGRNATAIEKNVLGFARMAEPLVHNKDLARQMSEELAGVAINMAKALHMSDEDAAGKLEAGFRGSAKALREFGIDLSTTALKHLALTEGFKGSVAHLNAAQLAYLRYVAIMKQSNDLTARASAANNDYSNVLATMKSHYEGLMETIGAALLPIATGVVKLIDGLIREVQWFLQAFAEGFHRANKELVESLTPAFAWLADTFAKISDGIVEGIDFITDAFYHLAENIIIQMGKAFDWLAERIPALHNVKVGVDASAAGAVSGLQGANQRANASHHSGLAGLAEVLKSIGHGIADAVKTDLAFFGGGGGSGAMPSAGAKQNTAHVLAGLSTSHQDSAGAGGGSANAAAASASAAWFAAQSSMSAMSKQEAQAALRVAQDEAQSAASASEAADAYARVHKHSKLAAAAAQDAAASMDEATMALATASQAYADRLQAETDAEAAKMQALATFQQTLLGQILPSGVSKILQGVAQGAAAAGPWGAVIGGLIAVLAENKGFKELINQISGIIKQFADALTPLITALRPLIGFIGQLIVIVGKVLLPIFTALGKILTMLAPILEIIVQVLGILVKVCVSAGQSIDKATHIFDILKAIFDAIAAVLKVVGSAIIIVLLGLAEIWNGIVLAVQGFINFFVWIINSALGWLGVHVNKVNFSSAMADTGALTKALHDLWQVTDNQAIAAGNAAASNQELANSAQAAADALTNVPSGMDALIYQLRYMTTSSVYTGTLPHFAAGGHVDRPTLALVGESGGETIIPDSKLPSSAGGSVIGQVVIVSNDPVAIWNQLQQLMKNAGVRMNGLPFTATGARFSVA